MRAGRPVIALLLLLQAGAAYGESIPHPELVGLEPAVAEQVRELRAGVEQSPDGEPARKALRFGELGALYHSLNFFEAALACYRSAESLAPGDGRWPYMQGVLHTDTGDIASARESLLRAMAVQSNLTSGWVRLGRLALDAGEAEQALLHFRRALSSMPESPAALAGAGQALLALDRSTEAIERLEQALEIEPRATRLHYPLAMAYRDAGDTEAMQSHLERVGSVGVSVDDPVAEFLARHAAGARVHIQQGNKAYRAGDYESAVESYRRATEAAPEEVTAWINLGAAQASLDRRDDSRRSLERALELAPDNATALENLLALLMQSGERPAARALLDEHLPDDSENRQLLRARAVLRREAGAPGTAMQDYRRLTELDPGAEAAWRGLVAAAVEAGRLDRVDELLGEASEALENPSSFRLELVDSLVAAHEGNPAEADLARRIAGELYAEQPEAERAVRVVRSLLLGADGCDGAFRWLDTQLDGSDLDESLAADLRDIQSELASLERCSSADNAGGGNG